MFRLATLLQWCAAAATFRPADAPTLATTGSILWVDVLGRSQLGAPFDTNRKTGRRTEC